MASETEAQQVHAEDREYVEQLAKLQSMHGQIHNLRGLLPERLLKPTRAALQHPSRSSPAKLAASLRETAQQGSKDIRKFSTDFRSESMQQLWQKASSGDFPQGQDAWTVDYEGLAKSSPQTQPPAQVNGTGPGSEVENVEDILKKFRESNPTIKVTNLDTSATFPLNVAVGELRFVIAQEEIAGKHVYRVTEQQEHTSALLSSIVKAINRESAHTSLEVLLSMLASYKNLNFQPCSKCQAIFDQDVTYPIYRQRKPPSDKDDTTVHWNALHRGCLA